MAFVDNNKNTISQVLSFCAESGRKYGGITGATQLKFAWAHSSQVNPALGIVVVVGT